MLLVVLLKLLLVVGQDWAVYLSCNLLYVERLMILSVGWFIPPHTNSFLIPRKDLFWLLKLLVLLLKFWLIWDRFGCVFF